MLNWRVKVSLGAIPMDHISTDQRKAIRSLCDSYYLTAEDIYIAQELDSESELGWSNVFYMEIAVPATSPYIHIFTLRSAVESLGTEIRDILGCDVPKAELDRARHWIHNFRMFGDGCAEYA